MSLAEGTKKCPRSSKLEIKRVDTKEPRLAAIRPTFSYVCVFGRMELCSLGAGVASVVTTDNNDIASLLYVRLFMEPCQGLSLRSSGFQSFNWLLSKEFSSRLWWPSNREEGLPAAALLKQHT